MKLSQLQGNAVKYSMGGRQTINTYNVIVFGFLCFIAALTAQANPRILGHLQDPAPISDEILKKLPAMHPAVQVDIAQEIQQHHTDIQDLLTKEQPDSAKSSDGQRQAFLAKAQELEQLAHNLETDARVSATIRKGLQTRLAELQKHIQILTKATSVNQHQLAMTHLDNYLNTLKPPAQPLLIPATPNYKYQREEKFPALAISRQNPAYLARYQPFAPVQLAALGGNETLAALLPPMLDSSSCAYQAADVADDGHNVLLTTEIRKLAAQLNYSPLQIIAWIQQNIVFQPYSGALKGSQATLLSRAGGVTDIASLTIALLRASNIPARYVFGNISIADDTPSASQARIARWLGVQSYKAAQHVMSTGYFSGVSYVPAGATDATATGINFDHTWVEACVPYAHYRGSRADTGGQRWIPIDAGFQLPQYSGGLSTASLDLNYTNYLSTRTTVLPDEQYESVVTQYFASLIPAQTIDAVPYSGDLQPLQWDMLPSSLPYKVNNFNIVPGTTSAEAAVLPASLQYRLAIDVKNAAKTALATTLNLYLPDIALKRLTLDFEGASPAAVTALQNWQKDGSSTTVLPCPLAVVPVIKLEGAVILTGNGATDLCSQQNVLDLSVTQDAINANVNTTEFTTIGAANLHALHVDALQNSEAVIQQRAALLLNTVAKTVNPDLNLDSTEGEFLNIVGRKYLHYVDLSTQRIGQLSSATGLMGVSLGLTSTQAKVTYAFDLPFGLTRSGYLVDMPALQNRSSDISTGGFPAKAFKLSSYTASAYESYIWQENARLDAVSTVRGIQYANEHGIAVLTLTSSNWASQKSLLTSNADATLNYSATDVATLESKYFCSTCTGNTLTIPRSKIRYIAGTDSWTGYVYTQTGAFDMHGIISGGYNGGYTLSTPISYDYNSVLDTGYTFSTPTTTPDYSIWSSPSTAPAPVNISAAVNTGFSSLSLYSNDPVNLVNGNLYHNEQDIKIKGRGGLDFIFERAYNSSTPVDGPLGYGWTHSFNPYLLFADDNPDGQKLADDTDGKVSSIVWVDGSGSRKSIASNASATTFTTPSGFFFTVSRPADNSYSIQEKNGLSYVFEAKTPAVAANTTAAYANRARLLKVIDRNTNTLTLSYASTGGCDGSNVCAISDGLNRALNFTYTGTHLTQISDWSGRAWTYGYDGASNLATYLTPYAAANSQNAVNYRYYASSDGVNLNHAMQQYILPLGNGMSFEYYQNGRVFRHYKTLRPDEVVAFTYNDFRRETIVTDELGNTKHHFFDRFGNPIKQIAEDGGVSTYAYDCLSTSNCPNPYNKLSDTDPLGLSRSYTYDNAGNLIKEVHSVSGATSQSFDFAANTKGRPRRIQNARNNWTIYRYDANGNVTDEIRLKSGVTPVACVNSECAIPAAANISAWVQNQYDAYGNVTLNKRVRNFTSQVGPTLALNYNDTVNQVVGLNAVTLTRTGDKNGDGTLDAPDTANLTYDNLGRVLNGLDGHWRLLQTLGYDLSDRPTGIRDLVGREVSVNYDANGNPIKSTTLGVLNPGGNQSQIQYQQTEQNRYDNDDHLITSIDNLGATVSHEYDAIGNKTATTNADGWRVTFQYDAMRRVTQTTDGNGYTSKRAYDIEGRPKSEKDALGLTIIHSYYGAERDGRLKRSTLPVVSGHGAGRAVEYDYDLNGNVIRQSDIGDDGSSRDHLSFYDEQDRLVRQVGPLVDGQRRQVCRQYSNLGELVQLWMGATTDTTSATCNFADANLVQQAVWSYDDFGRKLSSTDGLNRSWHWTYDSNDNLQTAQDAKAQITNYTWTAGGLPKTRTDAAQNLTTWVYDSLGRLQSLSDSNVTYTYGYDGGNRLKSFTDSRGAKTFSYAYSDSGLLNRVTDGENRNTDYLYDASGRMTGQWLPNNDYISWGYDAAGRLTDRTASSGIKANYDWFEDGSLKSVLTLSNYTTAVSSSVYTLSAYGERATVDQNLGGTAYRWRYVYDANAELRDAYLTPTLPTPGSESLYHSYRYDAWGNRSKELAADGSYLLHQYDHAQQLTETDAYSNLGVKQAVISLLQYDPNGSLLSKQVAGGNTSNNWDALNRLSGSGVFSSTGTLLSYQNQIYDPLDRRISKSSPNGTVNYLYNGPHTDADVYATYPAWGATSNPSALFAQGIAVDRPLTRLPLVNNVFQASLDYHADGLGSVSAISQKNIAGGNDSIQVATFYDPWGIIYPAQVGNRTSVDPGWQGREQDETGLYYFRARYYDAGGPGLLGNTPQHRPLHQPRPHRLQGRTKPLRLRQQQPGQPGRPDRPVGQCGQPLESGHQLCRKLGGLRPVKQRRAELQRPQQRLSRQ